ncbi:MAG: DUF2318 domain-containing protein [Clostridia bacterium]|nr:DUF2318 domain-containing protein [Clostridia bacterium]
MLNYFIQVTENITVAAILLGLLYSYISLCFGKRARLVLNCGVALGFIGAIAVAVLKNTTKIIDKSGGTGMLNVRTFSVSTILLIIFYVLSLKPVQKRLGKACDVIVALFAAGLACALVFYSFPDVLAYPFTFSLGGESVLSTAFFYRLIGYLLGLLLMLLVFLSVKETAKKIGIRYAGGVLYTALLINGLQQIFKGVQVLNAKRILKGNFVFGIVRFTSNYSNLFIYGAMLAAFIIPLTLFIKSMNVKEPYTNPAEHRKIKAKWRDIKRLCALVTACFIMVVLNLTVIKAIDSKEVELSPAVEAEVKDGKVVVALTEVEDGHLHRFVYNSAGGVGIRFIVIKKPNSSAYGIGLDACDICGETGYYERNGQVVCNLCDVVMNINTIGFKGGCNPIVFEYTIENGYIIIPVENLLEHEKEFK